MANRENVEQVNRAISELADAALPVVHRVVEVLQSNVDQMSGTGKELLEVVRSNADGLVKATSRLASSGVQLATGLIEDRGNQDRPLRPVNPDHQ